MDFWRFSLRDLPGPRLHGSHDWALVVLSVLVASLAAFVALAVVRRMRATADPIARRTWHLVGAVSMGTGVWAMHFTAMLAFSMPVPMGYVGSVTLLSAVPAVIGSALALRIMTRTHVDGWRLLGGGLSLALGIGTMHYVGMEAMRGEAVLRYDPVLFLASILVALVLATLALYVRFALLERDDARFPVQLVSAILMGCAVSGMHYTAMRAALFFANPSLPEPGLFMEPSIMGGYIVTLVTLFLALALVGVAIDRRIGRAESSAQASASRHRAVLEAMVDGILTVTDEGLIESLNPAVEVLIGLPEDELIGRALSDFVKCGGRCSGGEPGSGCSFLEEWGPCPDLVARHRDGTTFPIEARSSLAEVGSQRLVCVVIRDVTERRAYEMELRRLAAAIDQVSEAIVLTDSDGRIQYVNPMYTRMTGVTRSEAEGQLPEVLRLDGPDPKRAREAWNTIRSGQVWQGRCVYRSGEAVFETETALTPIRADGGEIRHFVEVRRDVTEKEALERRLASARKLESIGQLAAGIAHEINTPTQYVGDNTRFLEEATSDLWELIGRYDALYHAAETGIVPPELLRSVREGVEEADLEYLAKEIPAAIRQSLDGIERVTRIVQAMKEFSHPSLEKTPTNLNDAIMSTITVATNEWKYVADVHTELADDLPDVPCVPGEFNQVVLNIIVNAAQAIAEVMESGSTDRGSITIGTRAVPDGVEISIRDTGGGIHPENLDRIFDPFFTTKEVGKGTGQGLNIAHTVIVQKHGGTIEVESEPGVGTTFVLWLPLVAAEEEAAA